MGKNSLNKLQDYMVPDMDLCKEIIDKEFDNIYQWRKWAVEHIRTRVTGYMSKKKATMHIAWIEAYLLNRKELVNRIINERSSKNV